MANWYGAARSNYVKVKDIEALKKTLEPWPISVCEENGRVCLLSEEEVCGGWPDIGYDGNEIEVLFSFENYVCPHLVEGEILVTKEAGAEKLRYITGRAVAYNCDGDSVVVDLDDIYSVAAEKFDVEFSSITKASY